jgi:hypothetical protein
MRYVHDMTEEERKNELFDGKAVPVLEMWVIAIAQKYRGLEAVELMYQPNCGDYHPDPVMMKKINRISKICSNTVMNVDDGTKDEIHNSLLKEKGVGIRLYWLQVLMSLGNNYFLGLCFDGCSLVCS